MNAMETFQASRAKMVNLVLDLVEGVKQGRVSAREAVQKLDIFTDHARAELAVCTPQVQGLMSGLLNFFGEARRLIVETQN